MQQKKIEKMQIAQQAHAHASLTGRGLRRRQPDSAGTDRQPSTTQRINHLALATAAVRRPRYRLQTRIQIAPKRWGALAAKALPQAGNSAVSRLRAAAAPDKAPLGEPSKSSLCVENAKLLPTRSYKSVGRSQLVISLIWTRHCAVVRPRPVEIKKQGSKSAP